MRGASPAPVTPLGAGCSLKRQPGSSRSLRAPARGVGSSAAPRPHLAATSLAVLDDALKHRAELREYLAFLPPPHLLPTTHTSP